MVIAWQICTVAGGIDKAKEMDDQSVVEALKKFIAEFIQQGDYDVGYREGAGNITGLIIRDAKVSAGDLQGLPRLPELTSLFLYRVTPLGDALTPIEGIPGLQDLRLYRTRIGDKGLEHVRGLSQLVRLEVAECGVTDSGMPFLRDLNWTAPL